MPDIGLSLAISYYDHASDLLRGKVKPEGISLTTIELPVEEIFFRTVKYQEFDVAEFAMGKYMSLVAAGENPFVAIPVFPSRVFRQSAFYVHTKAGIRDAKDLAGRRVGVPEWAQTAGIYARAYLQHQCGVPLREVRWVQAGVNDPGRAEKVDLSLPDGIQIERVADKSLSQMLVSGELDAAITAREPDSFVAGDPNVARLWSDPRALEETYYRETGIFPIMHAMVIKKTTLEQHPWIAMNLYKAFEQSKANAQRHMNRAVTARIAVPWFYRAVEDARRVFGDDFWPYGIEKNRKTLDAFLQYGYEQGVAKRRLQVEDLFPKELAAFTKT
ncbi:MAG: 4,5-dihydroxyphthalate decarboxylase [Bryobacteraceae bacterium]